MSVTTKQGSIVFARFVLADPLVRQSGKVGDSDEEFITIVRAARPGEDPGPLSVGQLIHDLESVHDLLVSAAALAAPPRSVAYPTQFNVVRLSKNSPVEILVSIIQHPATAAATGIGLIGALLALAERITETPSRVSRRIAENQRGRAEAKAAEMRSLLEQAETVGRLLEAQGRNRAIRSVTILDAPDEQAEVELSIRDLMDHREDKDDGA